MSSKIFLGCNCFTQIAMRKTLHLHQLRRFSYLRVSKLEGSDKLEKLQKLEKEGWVLQTERDAITKSFAFVDFVSAFAFMTSVAFKAELMGHHPEWFNVYNRVDVLLSTHDCSGLSIKDYELALAIDRIYKNEK